MAHGTTHPREWPVIVRPTGTNDLSRLMTTDASSLQERLRLHGALLFRGFNVRTAEAFREVAAAMSNDLLAYMYRSTPRTALADGIYTASEYAPSAEIPMHNENAYQHDWPLRLLFGCIQAAATGGQTPLARTARVTARIDPAIRDTFERKQVMYVRNYGLGVDLPWQTVFQTEDTRAVEAFCAQEQIQVEWLPDDCLRTRQVSQATAVHPFTGETLWFNQAHLFHISSVAAKTRATLRALYRDDELPRNACYGDGEPIPDDIVDRIRQAYQAETIVFGWETGDVLLVDNMQVLHGRTPYTGSRTVLVAMSDSYRAARRASVEVMR
jgi:alpha-ketoglutarate-dependent taurine dioxygenase